ncbi:lysozyme inhibitor LprI family protein [Luteibacter yeojuensis]|nr:lysozyme inhibitor LprI family protein [Luteibacter yeojuensis]
MALCLAGAASAAPQDTTAAYDTQDARLNAAYKALSKTLDDAGRKALRDEERQWITGRDTVCTVPAGTVVKNQCTTTQTSFRADELEKRAKGGVASPGIHGNVAGVAGDWAYRSKCNFGHFVELTVTGGGSTAQGTWSDGTRVRENEGKVLGEWKADRLYLRFCADNEERGGFPVCPAFSDVAAYVVPEGNGLAWYRTWGPKEEGAFTKYVVMTRKPAQGHVPDDTHCTEDN